MLPIDTNDGGDVTPQRNGPSERLPGQSDIREIARTVIRAELQGQKPSLLKRREIRRFAQEYGLSAREVSELLGEATIYSEPAHGAVRAWDRASFLGWGFMLVGAAGLLQALWLLVTRRL